jgi:hypothetical protein
VSLDWCAVGRHRLYGGDDGCVPPPGLARCWVASSPWW